MSRRTHYFLCIGILLALVLSACNLSSSDVVQETIQSTGARTSTGLPSRTPNTTSGAPTPLPLASFAPTLIRPTSIVSVPQTAVLPPRPTNTALAVSIVILSPVPGNVVAGNVQVLGAATYPQFLQYQVEFGPDPNPGQLWYPATNAVQQPVLNGLLGVWNTTATQDGLYQLRLRVYLRDGTTLSTIVNNVRVQNRQPTPIPSATQSVPRPIAAFNQDVASGQVPLTVHFTNQSSGTITNVNWNFGDGQSSSESNPAHTFNSVGLYSVTLTVTGPGGSSNVSRQINVQSQSAPVAAFTQDITSGTAPLTVHFTNQSSGTISSLLWNFSDGTTSNESNPTHIFNVPGTYNVFLTVTGPGGTSTTTRQFVVNAPPTATFTPTWTSLPPTATFTSVPPTATFTGVPPTATFTVEPPTATLTETATTTFTAEPPTATLTETATSTAEPPTATSTETETATSTPTDTTTPVQNVVDSIDVMPNFASNASNLQSIYITGPTQLQPKQAIAFSIVGDEQLTAQGILTPFADPQNYNLGANADLQGIVGFYDDDPSRSFTHISAAVNPGWTAANVVNQQSTDATNCPGLTAFQCELNTNAPAVILINVGYYDALNGTSSADFGLNLDQIVQTAISNGTIPVLLTIPTSSGLDPLRVNEINNQILTVASQRQVPVLNTGRVLNELQQTVSPNGPGYLDDASTYEVNALNLYILQTLRSVLNTAAPGTVP